MLKAEARKIFKARRKSLSVQEMEKLDDLMLIRFQTISLPFLSSILSYQPMAHHHEPDTHLITRYLQFQNPELKVAYPLINPDGSMQAVITDEETVFQHSMLNIAEPVNGIPLPANEIDLVFVPLLAFDRAGYRVGFGKGFYDRFLPSCRPDCLKIGFSYFDPIDEITDRHQFDVPLYLCITPNKAYAF